MKNKKALAAAILAAVTLGVSAPAFAAHSDASVATEAPMVVAGPQAGDITWSGEWRYRWFNADNGVMDNDDKDSRLRITANVNLTDNLSAKVRFADLRTSDADTKSSLIDQYSLTYKFADNKTSVTVGKDDVWLGNGLLMDNFFKSGQVKTTIGSVGVTAFTGHHAADDDLSGAGVTFKSGKVDLGVNYVKYDDLDLKATSINANYKVGKVAFGAEIGEFEDAASTTASTALVTATIGELNKKGDCNYTISYYKVPVAGGAPLILDTTLDVIDSKGIIVGVNHKFSNILTGTLEKHFNSGVIDADLTRLTLTAKF